MMIGLQVVRTSFGFHLRECMGSSFPSNSLTADHKESSQLDEGYLKVTDAGDVGLFEIKDMKIIHTRSRT